MEHFKEGQYDDDLTQGSYDDDLTADIEEYDEDFDTGDVDLFGYTDDEDSVLGRLKSIILSIEWEITDDILRQFNEELLDLKNIWAGNKVNLIYVQALEKISRYIYKEKSSAHPNAIKLLLTFYTNLEKIVSDDTMSEMQQKKMLRTDINMFERLKKQISESSEVAASPPSPKPEKAPSPKDEPAPQPAPVSSDALIDDSPDQAGEPGQEDSLLNLKAIVYGIDWEITERDLKNLSREVKRLEKEYGGSKAKKIFLQGIGSLGAYINLKRSDAHADAFKLLHSFYMGLETVVRNNLSGQAEKDVLLPEVEKFNDFKGLIADTIAPEKNQSRVAAADEDESYEETEIRPAFADVPDDVRGYQAEEKDEAPASAAEAEVDEADEYLDDEEETSSPPSEADSALASEMESRLEGMFDEPSEEAVHQLDKNRALQGVDVETDDDDDSDEEPLPEHDGELAPALAAEDVFQKEESPAALTDKVDEFDAEHSQAEEPELLGDEVPGVDVEHEADDDSDEEPLPFDGDEYAPALSGDDTEVTARKETASEEPSDIDSRLDDFFGESTEEDPFKSETPEEKDATEPPVAGEDFEETAFEEPEPEEEAQESEPTSVDNEIDGRIDDFFDDDASEMEEADTEDPIKGVDVETPDDDDSDEEPLPLDGDELAPALSIDEEEDQEDEPDHLLIPNEDSEEDNAEVKTEEFFADDPQIEDISDEVAIEDTAQQDEASDVDARFDELFGGAENEEETALADRQDIGEELEPAIDDVQEDDSDIAKALDGVDVESGEDDDSDEEPLPFEDGELAPALGSEGDTDQHSELDFSDEEDEHEAAERFDDLFGTSEDEDSALEAQEDELSSDDEQDRDEIAEKDILLSEDEFAAEEEQDDERPIDADSAQVTDYEEAGFEEIWDDDIEDIPEETLAAADEEIITESQQEKDKEEILAYFADDDQEDSEEDIPEMEADEFATVIDDTEPTENDVTSPGYASPDELLRQFDETTEVEEDVSVYSGEEDDIPEMEVDDLATVIEEGSGITSAGAVPSGYPSADELLRKFGEVAGEEQAEDVVIGTVGSEEFASDEEDVVFEAVDETSETSPVDESGYEDDDTFGITLLDDGEYGGKTVQDTAGDAEHEEVSEEVVEDSQVAEDPRSSAYVKPQVEIPIQESLSGMRNCIASLGLEIDSDILDSMNAEIEKLRHAWMDKPAEKTFIQLLSTIASHINRYRYEADQEANKLLLSVFDKLELTATGQADGAEIQEALLNETSKVLQWQARLIDRAPATAGSGESSIFVEGLSSDDSLEPQAMLGEAGTDEEYSAHLEDMSRQVDEIGNDMLMQKVSSVMKTELDQLKAAFQSELMELRKEILKSGKDNHQ